jgi:sulfur carrier protein ThiS
LNTLRIVYNGLEHILREATTLEQLLASQQAAWGTDTTPVASAVNGVHVARHARPALALKDGDVVTTFEPISGG